MKANDFLRIFSHVFACFSFLAIPSPLIMALSLTRMNPDGERLFQTIALFLGFYLLSLFIVFSFGSLLLILLFITNSLSQRKFCVVGLLFAASVHVFLRNSFEGIFEAPGFYIFIIQGWFSGWIVWYFWERAWRPIKSKQNPLKNQEVTDF